MPASSDRLTALVPKSPTFSMLMVVRSLSRSWQKIHSKSEVFAPPVGAITCRCISRSANDR